jgi:nitroreductase
MAMEGLDVILTRRSIRKYEDKAVGEEKIISILKAGMFAPSAHNSQPWEFIVIKDKEMLIAMSRIGKYWTMLSEAALAIVTVANLKGYMASHTNFFIQDCSAATENMLLAAHALGLGGVWLGLYLKEKETVEVRKLLNIPGEIIPFSVISLGYPAETKGPHQTFRQEKVYYEKYK